MIKTTQQYLKKMEQLRKKRDYHLKKYEEFKEKMNNLEINQNFVESKIQKGKYYKVDFTNNGGSTYYVHVEKIVKDTRGMYLVGHAFHQTNYNFGLFVEKQFRILWHDIDDFIEITDNEYYSAYNSILQESNNRFFKEEENINV